MNTEIKAALDEVTLSEVPSAEVIGWRPLPDAERWKGTETILFVEDEAFVREVTTEVLCAAGYGVLTAGNAEDAVRLYERHSGSVDLVLTDLVLPGETGCQLAAWISERDPSIKILFVTGYIERVKMVEGQEYLPKPFSTSALLERVRQILDRRELAAAI